MNEDKKDQLIDRLRAEIAGLQAHVFDQAERISALEIDNAELRFNWIAAAEGDILDDL